MSGLPQKRVAVIGSGVFGSAVALQLARAGARVVIIERDRLGRSASGIAAGMLAPAMEAALDPVSGGRFALLAKARDLWPSFVEGLGPTGLERCGSLLRAPDNDLLAIDAVLASQGAACAVRDGLLFTPEDWRIEPRLALAAMREGLLALGGEARRGAVEGVGAGDVRLADGETIEADEVVLACGMGGLRFAPELAVLAPIKGQLLRFPDADMTDGPILRSLTGYAVPGRDGPVCGATMEAGVDNLLIDADATALLKARAAALAPQLGNLRPSPAAGVRAATPDGLPLVGPSTVRPLWIAAGARRNGWLLAPMVARLLARQMAGEEVGAEAALFAPARFNPPG